MSHHELAISPSLRARASDVELEFDGTASLAALDALSSSSTVDAEVVGKLVKESLNELASQSSQCSRFVASISQLLEQHPCLGLHLKDCIPALGLANEGERPRQPI